MGKSVDRKQVDEIKILFDVVSYIYKKNTEKDYNEALSKMAAK